MRSKGSAAELEALRMRAVRAVLAGESQAAVARAFGVHNVTIAKWMARHRRDGDAGLQAKPTPGRPRFLTPKQDQLVRKWLSQKPTAHGVPTDLWTARRVAELIRHRLGVVFHPNYLRAWLTQRGYSPQRPARRPRQRNEAKIIHWVANDWPRIQKKRATPKPTSF
jgi:transposase